MLDLRDIVEQYDSEDEEEREEAKGVVDAIIRDITGGDIENVRELAENEPIAIPDDEFEDYARDLADDSVPNMRTIDAVWPFTCIDWEDAADELKNDYSCFEVDGETYWVRSY